MKTTSQRLLRFTLIASMPFVLAGSAMADQPHMEAALARLQAARAELVQALSNKGGWRDAAIASVDEAIRQVRIGMHYAATH